jgi:hypothetical protein
MCGLLGQQSDDITGALLSLWLVKRAIPQLHPSFLPTSFAGQLNAVLYKSLGSVHRPVRKNARISSGGASSAAGPQFGAALLSVFCIYLRCCDQCILDTVCHFPCCVKPPAAAYNIRNRYLVKLGATAFVSPLWLPASCRSPLPTSPLPSDPIITFRSPVQHEDQAAASLPSSALGPVAPDPRMGLDGLRQPAALPARRDRSSHSKASSMPRKLLQLRGPGCRLQRHLLPERPEMCPGYQQQSSLLSYRVSPQPTLSRNSKSKQQANKKCADNNCVFPSAVCTGTAPASFVSPGPTATAVSYVPNAYFSFHYIATYFDNGGYCSAAVSQCSANYAACTSQLGGGAAGAGYPVTIVVPGGGGTTVTAGAGATVGAASATSICEICVLPPRPDDI